MSHNRLTTAGIGLTEVMLYARLFVCLFVGGRLYLRKLQIITKFDALIAFETTNE